MSDLNRAIMYYYSITTIILSEYNVSIKVKPALRTDTEKQSPVSVQKITLIPIIIFC